MNITLHWFKKKKSIVNTQHPIPSWHYTYVTPNADGLASSAIPTPNAGGLAISAIPTTKVSQLCYPNR